MEIVDEHCDGNDDIDDNGNNYGMCYIIVSRISEMTFISFY